MARCLWLGVSLALCMLFTLNSAFGQCVSYKRQGLELPEASGLKCGHACLGEKGWKTLPVIWAPLHVEINCSTSSYTVLTAHSSAQLVAGDVTPVRWCGWHHILVDPRVCHFSLSPLQDYFLAVDPGENGGSFFSTSGSSFTCEVDSTRELSVPHMCLTVLGVLLFFNARSLSLSTYFRLSSGTLMFVSGAVVVLAFIMMRHMPYKRSLIAFFTVSTSTMLAAVRWLYGTWLPDWQTVVFSRPFVIYVLVAGLAGLTVTYWMDDSSNVKLNTTIRVTLQLSGLLMVYSGVADDKVAIAAVLAVLFGRLLATIVRGLWRALRWSLSRSLSRRAAAGGHGLKLGRNQRESRHHLPADEEPLLSDEDDEQAAGTSRRYQQQRHHVQLAANQPLDKLPSFDTWVPERQQQQQWQSQQRQQQQRRRRQQQQQQERSPLHLRTPPPMSPFVSDPHWMLDEREGRELYMLPQELHGSGTAAGSAPPDAGTYKFPSSSSPWSAEKVAVDLSRRRPPSASPATSPASAVGAARDDVVVGSGPAGAAVAGPVSPLVQAGKIINPESGRPILMHRGKYNELINQGYTPDLANGVLLPPAAAAAAAGSSGAGAAGTSGGSASTGTPRTRRRPSSR